MRADVERLRGSRRAHAGLLALAKSHDLGLAYRAGPERRVRGDAAATAAKHGLDLPPGFAEERIVVVSGRKLSLPRFRGQFAIFGSAASAFARRPSDCVHVGSSKLRSYAVGASHPSAERRRRVWRQPSMNGNASRPPARRPELKRRVRATKAEFAGTLSTKNH